jgi:hypothetical protein
MKDMNEPVPENDYAPLKPDLEIVDIVCHDGAVVILPTDTFVFVEGNKYEDPSS